MTDSNQQKNTFDDRTVSKLLLDFYMYDVIHKSLSESIESEIKRYGNLERGRKVFEKFKNNKFHTFGKMNLAKEKIQSIKEEHDRLLKELLINIQEA